jgi:hypothetical protein
MRRCAGKRRWEDKAQAAQARAAMCAARRLLVGNWSVYRCDQCLGWHVGGSSNTFHTRMHRKGKRPNKRLRGRV